MWKPETHLLFVLAGFQLYYNRLTLTNVQNIRIVLCRNILLAFNQDIVECSIKDLLFHKLINC